MASFLIVFINHVSCYNNGEKNASCIKTKKSRLLKAKEKKSCAATIKDLPVKIVLPLDGLPDLCPREQSIPHMDNCNAKLLCKLAAPYMYLYCNNGQFFMFFIIKMFIFQKV